MLNKLQAVVGQALTVLCGAVSIFSGVLLIRGGLLTPIYLSWFVFSFTGFLVGWKLASHGKRKLNEKAESEQQQTVLSAVKSNGGRLTGLQLAAESGWTLEASDEALKQFVSAGVAETDFSAQGDIVYVFRSMVDRSELENVTALPLSEAAPGSESVSVISSPEESLPDTVGQATNNVVENENDIET